MQCPSCSLEMYGYQYEGKGVFGYNGPSEWRCDQCPVRLGYFCNQPLGVDEVEPVECQGCKHHPRYVEI